MIYLLFVLLQDCKQLTNSEEVGIVCLCGHISDRMNLNMWQGRMSALAILCLSLVLLPGICSLLCCQLPGGSLGSAADPQEKAMLTIYYIGVLIATPSIHLWSTKTCLCHCISLYFFIAQKHISSWHKIKFYCVCHRHLFEYIMYPNTFNFILC